MHNYYGLKERFDYTLNDKNEFIENILKLLENFVVNYDYIIFPESSSTFLMDLAKRLEKPFIEIKKTNLSDVKVFMNGLALQKKEKKAHLERFEEMNGVFKINKLKATQRVKYEEILFQKCNLLEGKGLIIDDSCFSGTTYRALKKISNDCDYLAIFSK